MSTITTLYTDSRQAQRGWKLRWETILITISFFLILVAVLGMVLSKTKHQTSFQADLVPVVTISITPIPAPTPPLADIQPAQLQLSRSVPVLGTEVPVQAVPVPLAP